MVNVLKSSNETIGGHLVDSLIVSEHRQNLLFSALILTMVMVYCFGNLLLLQGNILYSSTRVLVVCLGLVSVFYMITNHLKNPIWGLVITYVLLAIIVLARASWVTTLFSIFCAFSFLYMLLFLRLNRKNWSALFGMSLLGTTVILGVVGGQTSFDMLPRVHNLNVHTDTLFHVSISAMIKNYGVASTGLHGLVETPYHIFSHVLMAGISLLSGESVLEVYGVANSAFFAPILLFSCVSIITMLDREETIPLPRVWNFVTFLLWLMPMLFRSLGVWNSYFVSESYLVAIGLLSLGMGLLFKRQQVLSDTVLVAFISLLIVVSKASVGLIFSGLLLMRLIFIPCSKKVMILLSFFLSAGVVGWGAFYISGANGGLFTFKLWHFMNTHAHLPFAVSWDSMPPQSIAQMLKSILSLIFFTMFHFVLSWIVVLYSANKISIMNVLSIPASLYSLAAACAGLLILTLFKVAGGSAYYFSNVSMIISLPIVAALLADASNQLKIKLQTLLTSSIFIVSLWSLGAYQQISFTNRPNVPVESELVQKLLEIRDTASKNTMWVSGKEFADFPSWPCGPVFLFPAVTERPWVNVIPSDPDCYNTPGAYGFANYELVPDKDGNLWPTVDVVDRVGATILERVGD